MTTPTKSNAPKPGTEKFALVGAVAFWPHVVRPHAFQDAEAKYSVTLLIDKTGENADKAREMVRKIQASHATGPGEGLPSDRLCIADGDVIGKPGMEGKLACRFSSKIKPQVLLADNSPLASDEASPFATGCIVDAVVSLWYMDNRWGRRVNGNIHTIRFVEFGDAPQADDYSNLLPDRETVADAPAEVAVENTEDDGIPF